MRRALAASLLLAGLASAAPFAYRVASGEGTPADFQARVEKAFAAWTGVKNTTLQVQRSETGNTVFAYGDGGVPFNPDVAVRTTVAEGASGTTEARVNPDSPIDLDSALTIEAGRRLGVNLDAAASGTFKVGEAEGKLLAARYSQTGDLNADGRVDIDDLAILAANYGKSAPPGGAAVLGDLNGDGKVDDADLEVLKKTYSFEAPPAPAAAPTTGTTPATPGATPTPPTTPPATTPTEQPATPAPEQPATPPAEQPTTPPAEEPTTPPADQPTDTPPATPGG